MEMKGISYQWKAWLLQKKFGQRMDADGRGISLRDGVR
jgi:hypothetical protein